jgi:hypothetical protein
MVATSQTADFDFRLFFLQILCHFNPWNIAEKRSLKRILKKKEFVAGERSYSSDMNIDCSRMYI